ncbi:MAG: (2Fe-2S)-binding protein [Planctomycetota bacterium]
MLVCHCKKKTDREIRHALAEGARTCEDVASRCEAGAACGGCRGAIRALLGAAPAPTAPPRLRRRS